jgi:predicted kinase
MAVASLVIAVAALAVSVCAARQARRARKSAEALLERTLRRTRDMKLRG